MGMDVKSPKAQTPKTRGLNIKNPEAYELARKLSQMTGDTLTETVIKALREQLAAESRLRDIEARRARIKAAVATIPDDERPSLSADDLYDEDGLPA